MFTLFIMFLCAAMAAGQGGSWVRQAEDVCFSAVERLNAELFQSRSSGFIGGVRFTHSGGGVACLPNQGLTDFGCPGYGLMTLLVSETPGAVMYPSAMTEGITGWGYRPNMMFDWYTMSRVEDGILTLIQPIYRVRRGEWFRVEYTEVFHDYSVDNNQGTSRIDVDFLLVSYTGGWNWPINDSIAVMSTVADVLVQ